MENINPNEKTSQTQNGKILNAYTRFNCTRLGARIYDIKNMNEEYKNKVVDRWVVLPSGKRVKEYRLEA